MIHIWCITAYVWWQIPKVSSTFRPVFAHNPTVQQCVQHKPWIASEKSVKGLAQRHVQTTTVVRQVECVRSISTFTPPVSYWQNDFQAPITFFSLPSYFFLMMESRSAVCCPHMLLQTVTVWPSHPYSHWIRKIEETSGPTFPTRSQIEECSWSVIVRSIY